MKNYAKVGNRKGRPAYRTPSHFRFNTKLKAANAKVSGKKWRGKIH